MDSELPRMRKLLHIPKAARLSHRILRSPHGDQYRDNSLRNLTSLREGRAVIVLRPGKDVQMLSVDELSIRLGFVAASRVGT